MSIQRKHLAPHLKVMLAIAFVSGLVLATGQAFASGTTHTPQPATTASTDHTLFHCVSTPHIQPPPSLLPRTDSQVDTLNPVCSAGQVPQPVGGFAPKGMPDLQQQPQTVSYFYDYAYQYYTAVGASGNFIQHKPQLSPSDYHSLAEIAGESSDGKQIVEIGWNVDRSVNHNDTHPHLFIYHWINGSPTCYNACGYVQYSKKRFPGMVVSVTKTPQKYAMEYMQGNWWLWYQTEWIGYFPGSLWKDSFTQLGLTQWFGEVAASSSSPCTDMGNGIFGTAPHSAVINQMLFINGPNASASPGDTNPSYYNIGNFTGSSYNYGGPGAC